MTADPNSPVPKPETEAAPGQPASEARPAGAEASPAKPENAAPGPDPVAMSQQLAAEVLRLEAPE